MLLFIAIFDDPTQLYEAYEAEVRAVFAVLEVDSDPPRLTEAQHSDNLVQFILSVDQSDIVMIFKGRFWNFLTYAHFQVIIVSLLWDFRQKFDSLQVLFDLVKSLFFASLLQLVIVVILYSHGGDHSAYD